MIFPRQTLEKLRLRKTSFCPLLLFILGMMVTSPLLCAAGEKHRAAESAGRHIASYDLPQPENETIDYNAYQRIRKEGTTYSHVMEYGSALMDAIGSRLTGSPNAKRANEWTRDQLKAMGCTNAHLEDWGEFGMSWQQLNTWVRMSSPDTAVFIAQASPWSPSTNGPVTAPAIWIDLKDEKDFDKYKGKLAGKIVLYGEMREVKPVDKALFSHLEDDDLSKLAEYTLAKREGDSFQQFLKRLEFREKVGKF